MAAAAQAVVDARIDELIISSNPALATIYNGRMVEVMAWANQAGWGQWKRCSVQKYMRTLLLGLSEPELRGMMSAQLREVFNHAAEGFDRWRARKLS